MKRLLVALFFCAGSVLSAQDRPTARLYFAPATGGSQEEREFFDSNIPLAIGSERYRIVDNPEEADFLASTTIANNDDPAQPSTLFLNLRAAAASGDSPTVELFWNYRDAEELYGWNIGAILSSQMSGDSGAPDSRRQRSRWFYAGLRGGLSLAGRYFQSTPGHYPGYSSGLGAEGGLVLELRLFRFFGLQAEGNFVYETFEAPGTTTQGDLRPPDSFTSMSLVFPLLAKAPLSFGDFTLSPYAGAYYVLALWDAEKQAGVSGETESVAVSMELPLGFIAGTEAGFSLGPGELFADLRYGRDLGATVLGTGEGYQHVRDRINVCLGYKFGF